MTLFKELLKAIREKESYEFDFEKRIIKVGEHDFNDSENLISESDLSNYYIENLFEEPWEVAELLFRIYYDSRGYVRKYPIFKHKPLEEMTADELLLNENIRFAEVQLEAYLLILGKLGLLQFDGFYYQHPIDKEFVVLKRWVENEKTGIEKQDCSSEAD